MAAAIRDYFMHNGGIRQHFKNGDLVRLRPALGDVKLRVVGPYDSPLDLLTVEVVGSGSDPFVISGHVLERRDPQWRAGDVIVVRHRGYGEPYTYVRSSGGWPTEHGTKYDEDINKWYQAGWVTPKLQSGGEPFDTSRL